MLKNIDALVNQSTRFIDVHFAYNVINKPFSVRSLFKKKHSALLDHSVHHLIDGTLAVGKDLDNLVNSELSGKCDKVTDINFHQFKFSQHETDMVWIFKICTLLVDISMTPVITCSLRNAL